MCCHSPWSDTTLSFLWLISSVSTHAMSRVYSRILVSWEIRWSELLPLLLDEPPVPLCVMCHNTDTACHKHTTCTYVSTSNCLRHRALSEVSRFSLEFERILLILSVAYKTSYFVMVSVQLCTIEYYLFFWYVHYFCMFCICFSFTQTWKTTFYSVHFRTVQWNEVAVYLQ